MSEVNVRTIVAEWLRQHGYAGLTSPGCAGCGIDRLPCQELDERCLPVYRCNDQCTPACTPAYRWDCPCGLYDSELCPAPDEDCDGCYRTEKQPGEKAEDDGRQDMSGMNVRTIVADWLREHGYDGLVDADGGVCGCDLDDLMPCGEASPYCAPAYLWHCPCELREQDGGELCPGACAGEGGGCYRAEPQPGEGRKP